MHFTIYMYSYRRETARQLRMYAQLTRCFSVVAELIVVLGNCIVLGLHKNRRLFVIIQMSTSVMRITTIVRMNHALM